MTVHAMAFVTRSPGRKENDKISTLSSGGDVSETEGETNDLAPGKGINPGRAVEKDVGEVFTILVDQLCRKVESMKEWLGNNPNSR